MVQGLAQAVSRWLLWKVRPEQGHHRLSTLRSLVLGRQVDEQRFNFIGAIAKQRLAAQRSLERAQ